MDEARLGSLLLPRLAYLLLACLFLFARLLPLHGSASSMLIAPDLLLALTLAILFRRPDVVPLWLIAPVFLAADLLLLRPPGLWTLLVVAATEIIRDRQVLTRSLPLVLEMAMVAGIVAALSLAEWLARLLFLLDDPGLANLLATVLATIICYPLIRILVRSVLGIRRQKFSSGRSFGRVL